MYLSAQCSIQGEHFKGRFFLTQYLSAMANALMNEPELGMKQLGQGCVRIIKKSRLVDKRNQPP
ncbi:hypothetical protein [Pseudomonas kurunegalensis]|uniref:hypothetical protein n=1 Tax=Pseudomonas kurunegalensis TaxID=485880 RepID=UPI00256FFF9D|nr:hypothetical protein [Pseudomonas kurunegalensis]WJD63277.1 hypothetical protein QQ992_02975 [Pseudomonas kurunegalensis]